MDFFSGLVLGDLDWNSAGGLSITLWRYRVVKVLGILEIAGVILDLSGLWGNKLAKDFWPMVLVLGFGFFVGFVRLIPKTIATIR